MAVNPPIPTPRSDEIPHSEQPVPPRRASVREYELDGEAVLYDLQTQGLHLLNQTAWSVWQRFDGQSTANALTEELVRTFRVDSPTAHDHVEQLVARFTQAGLLREDDVDQHI